MITWGERSPVLLPVDTCDAGITMHQMVQSAAAGGLITIDDLFTMPHEGKQDSFVIYNGEEAGESR